MGAYPAREFPNLPSFEESLDLWNAECEKLIPRKRRYGLVLAAALGLVLLVCSEWLFAVVQALGGTSMESGWLATGVFLVGVLLAWFPLAYFLYVWTKMPPRPTREAYLKTRALMQLYQVKKESMPC